MIRLAVKLPVLMLCLVIAVGAPAFAAAEPRDSYKPLIIRPRDNEAGAPDTREGDSQSIFRDSEGDSDRQTKRRADPQPAGIRDSNEGKAKEEPDTKDKNIAEEGVTTDGEDSAKQDIEGIKEDIYGMKQEMGSFAHITLVAGVVLGLFTVLNMIGLAYNLFFKASASGNLADRLADLKKELSKELLEELREKTLEQLPPKIYPGNSQGIALGEGETSVNKRLDEIERKVEELWNKRAKAADSSKPAARGPREHPMGSVGLQRVPRAGKTREIAEAFNEMREAAMAAGYNNGPGIQQEFVKKHKVVAFKCVNYEKRLLDGNVPPQFAVAGNLPESTLWGVPLSDGTLAVLPSLSMYGGNVHKYAGMKELFKSNYESGSYRKIVVNEPAIVRKDFTIIRQGELFLA